jgi:TetR/AcrR family transcriptional repressor of nem operon
MTSTETRQLLIEAGARLFHQNGYNNTGIQEILKETGIPKGSFYFHFKNKEDFALEVIEYYSEHFRDMYDKYANDKNYTPLTSLRNFLESFIIFYDNSGCKLGCPIGNFALEMSDLSEPIRKKLNTVFDLMRDKIASTMSEAQNLNEISIELNSLEIADFIITSWEGALLLMKTTKNTQPLTKFINILFTYILRA